MPFAWVWALQTFQALPGRVNAAMHGLSPNVIVRSSIVVRASRVCTRRAGHRPWT